jgi:hypothetical protein
MDITIGVTVSAELKPAARARCEELLVHSILKNNPFVSSALVLRAYPIGSSYLHDSGTGYRPDELTRESR